MHRILLTVASLVLLAAGCGDDGGTEAWCERARDMEILIDRAETGDGFRALAAAVDDATGSAPAEIRDAIDARAAFLGAMVDALAANGDNVLLAFDEVDQSIGTTDADVAAAAISAFNATECGIGVAPADDTGVDESPFDSGVFAGLAEQLGVTEDEARCLVRELDLGFDETPDPATLLDTLDTCGIDPFTIGAGG